jgi:adenosylcobinamide-phosphate synthase
MGTWSDQTVLAAFALVMALLVDVRWGEPPAKLHPVVWMGRFLDHAGRWATPKVGTSVPAQDHGAWTRGTLAWLAGAIGVMGVAWGLQCLLAKWPVWIAAPCLGLLLKPMLSWKMLRGEVRAVGSALSHSLAAGRERLAFLCSRDVHQLDATGVRETAIETLAENLNDSVVAPLFWFAMAGLPGAALYRYANTADAMWGYRGVRGGRCWEWAGKWAARADDVLSWVPARLTAALLVLAGGRLWMPGLSREARQTASPNGGWPMGAMALLLGVRLGKPGVYLLHAQGRGVLAGDMDLACRLAARTVWLSVPMCWLIAGGMHV